MNNNKPIGYLFESVAIYKPEDLNKLIESLNKHQSFFMIKQSLEFAHSKGLFNLQESELVSKSLRILSSEYNTKNDGTNEI